MSADTEFPRYNFAIFGDSGVGKTAFLKKLSGLGFTPTHNPTYKLTKTYIEFETNFEPVRVLFHDCPNLEKNYDAGIIVLDASSEPSLETWNVYHDMAVTCCGNTVICENKMDLLSGLAYVKHQAFSYGYRNSVHYDQISVKTGLNIDDPILHLLKFLTRKDNLRILDRRINSSNEVHDIYESYANIDRGIPCTPRDAELIDDFMHEYKRSILEPDAGDSRTLPYTNFIGLMRPSIHPALEEEETQKSEAGKKSEAREPREPDIGNDSSLGNYMGLMRYMSGPVQRFQTIRDVLGKKDEVPKICMDFAKMNFADVLISGSAYTEIRNEWTVSENGVKIALFDKNAVRVTANNKSGIVYPVDLRPFIGGSVVFSAEVATPPDCLISTTNNMVRIGFLGSEKVCSTCPLRPDWSYIAISFVVDAEDCDKKLYIGVSNAGEFLVKNPTFDFYKD